MGYRVTIGISCGHHLIKEVLKEHLVKIWVVTFVTLLWAREMRHGTNMSMMQRPERRPRSGESQERTSKEELKGETFSEVMWVKSWRGLRMGWL